ncbi:hypothetical protein [Nannocystis bainbridge]|uniref:Uncharacterized protein n=1 Tax=Nannocystis bainbridge TaxID=2995303 RepID=A0ABT5DT38_9BACT|nr:hypothetical protein [Nannocystis bainbridge]MDC0715577.1 hypothetical protein [Nannocystis bainbridge]
MTLTLFACGPAKQSDSDTTTGPTSTSTTSSSGTASTTSSSSTSPTTTGEPLTTSSSGTSDTEAATDSGTPSSSEPTGTEVTSTTGAPAGDCSDQTNLDDCHAIPGPGGHSDCVWVETVAQWSPDTGCEVVAGPAHCVQGFYVGDGCFGSGCPDLERVYVRDQGDGNFDVVNHPGGSCGVEPDGWEQCSTEFPELPEACGCVC